MPETAQPRKEIFNTEQRVITQMEKSKKMTKAEEKFRQAQAVYDQAVKDETVVSQYTTAEMSLLLRHA